MSDAESIAVPMPRARRPRRRGDAALLRAVDRADEAALAELFRRHWPASHRAAWLVTHDAQAAEDIAQEAFLAALQRLDSFDRRRPFRPWLHRIVVNRAVDFVRARAPRREVAAAALPEPIANEPRTLDEETVAALARLGPDHRAVVVLRHLRSSPTTGAARASAATRLTALTPAGEVRWQIDAPDRIRASR